MGEGDGDSGGAATEQGEAGKKHGTVRDFHCFVVVGGEELFNSVEVGGGEDVGEGGVGSGFDEEGSLVVAVDGGGVSEATGERVEECQHLGEGVLKEL